MWLPGKFFFLGPDTSLGAFFGTFLRKDLTPYLFPFPGERVGKFLPEGTFSVPGPPGGSVVFWYMHNTPVFRVFRSRPSIPGIIHSITVDNARNESRLDPNNLARVPREVSDSPGASGSHGPIFIRFVVGGAFERPAAVARPSHCLRPARRTQHRVCIY